MKNKAIKFIKDTMGEIMLTLGKGKTFYISYESANHKEQTKKSD